MSYTTSVFFSAVGGGGGGGGGSCLLNVPTGTLGCYKGVRHYI